MPNCVAERSGFETSVSREVYAYPASAQNWPYILNFIRTGGEEHRF